MQNSTNSRLGEIKRLVTLRDQLTQMMWKLRERGQFNSARYKGLRDLRDDCEVGLERLEYQQGEERD